MLLLNAISRFFEHFKDAMIYGWEKTIKLEDVYALLKSKELQKHIEEQFQKKHIEEKSETLGESLDVRWKKY